MIENTIIEVEDMGTLHIQQDPSLSDPLVVFNRENKEKLIGNDKDMPAIIKSAFIEYITTKPIQSFNSYQTLAHSIALYLNGVKELYPNLPKPVLDMLAISYVGLGLGEVGEVQNKLKKVIRDKNGIINDEFKNDIKKELGDILWYVSEMSTILGFNLEDVAQANIDKLFKRRDNNTLKGSGDNR